MSNPPSNTRGGAYSAALTTAAELRKWVEEQTAQWSSIMVATLNCRSTVRARSGAFVSVDEAQCRKSIVHVGNLIDRAVHGRLVQRFGRRVPRIPFLEYGFDRGWHCHLLIEPPFFMPRESFAQTLRANWTSCECGSTSHIRDGDEGSAAYLTKARSKGALEIWNDTLVVEGVVLRTK